MTPTIEQLRQWSAVKVMGWTEFRSQDPRRPYYGKDKGIVGCEKFFWRPDDPTTGQIWMVVEKMRELGWKFKLHGFMEYYTAIIWRDNDAVFLGIASPKIAEVSDDNPCLAILRAAWEAVEGE